MTIPAPEMTESELITWLKRQTLKTGTHYTLDDLAVLRALIARLSRPRAHPIGDTLAYGLIERLMGRAQWYSDIHPSTVKTPQLLHEAAAALTQLRERLAAVEREREDALDKLADAAEWRERVADDYGKALDALAASEANVLALRGLLMEARNEIDHYADTAREHDLVARIDTALAAPPEGL